MCMIKMKRKLNLFGSTLPYEMIKLCTGLGLGEKVAALLDFVQITSTP